MPRSMPPKQKDVSTSTPRRDDSLVLTPEETKIDIEAETASGWLAKEANIEPSRSSGEPCASVSKLSHPWRRLAGGVRDGGGRAAG